MEQDRRLHNPLTYLETMPELVNIARNKISRINFTCVSYRTWGKKEPPYMHIVQHFFHPSSCTLRPELRPNHNFCPYRTVSHRHTEMNFLEARHCAHIRPIPAKRYRINTEVMYKSQNVNILSYGREILYKSSVKFENKNLSELVFTPKTPTFSLSWSLLNFDPMFFTGAARYWCSTFKHCFFVK